MIVSSGEQWPVRRHPGRRTARDKGLKPLASLEPASGGLPVLASCASPLRDVLTHKSDAHAHVGVDLDAPLGIIPMAVTDGETKDEMCAAYWLVGASWRRSYLSVR